MTEAEWLTCADPKKMMAFLQEKASDRKLRLFAVACCRRIWNMLTDERSRTAIEIAEAYAEDKTSRIELRDANTKAVEVWKENFRGNLNHPHTANTAAESALRFAARAPGYATWDDDPIQVALGAALQSQFAIVWSVVLDVEQQRAEGAAYSEAERNNDFGGFKLQPARHAAQEAIKAEQAAMVREVFGNPFHPSPALPPAVLAWNDRTIPRIAHGIYDERTLPEGTLDNGSLAVLGDAIIDGSCEDEDLIAHCRSEGPHVRGCWAIDLILGKQ